MSSLLLSEVFPPRTGGSGRWFWELYRRLPRSEHAILAGSCPGDEDFDRGHDLGVTRIPLTFPTWGILSPAGLAAYRRTARTLARVVREDGVEVLHCARCLPEGLLGLWLRRTTGRPFLCYAHGEELTYAASSRELAWLMRRVYRGAAMIIANSLNTRRMLIEGWGLPESKLRILNPGVDTEVFSPSRRDPVVRARLGWGDRPVALSVARLQERKGHDVMIRALNAIRRVIPDVLYAIVGEGERGAALRELVASEGLGDHVVFHGEIDDAGALECFRQCDLFVLPNRQVGLDIEGFGIVLLEAQACGKPVLAGASGGTAETMRIPESGRVVDCEDPGVLADLVIELLSDRERLRTMGESARRWAVERFDWGILVDRAGHLFREMAAPADRTHRLGSTRT